MKQHIRTRSTQLALAALLAFVAACGNRDDSTAPTGNGSIVLTLTSPDGSSPAVTITGPNGFSRTVSGTSTLTHLEAGSYTITADSIVTQSTIVGYRVDTAAITGNPITVTSSGSSAATVSYTFARQHGALWVTSNSIPFLSGLASSQLVASGAPVATDTIGLTVPNSAGFDANGDMWVGSSATDTLQMFTVARRNGRNSGAAPSRVLISSSLTYAQSLAFDRHGNLWIADYNGGLLQFSAAQLAVGGDVGPAAITLLDTIPFAMMHAWAVAFDTAGNAWVGENNADNVIEYAVAQLAASGSPTPAVRLGRLILTPPRIVGGTSAAHRVRHTRGTAAVAFNSVQNLMEPDALAFDASNNLWVGNYQLANVVAYSPAQRASSGDPAPMITLSLPGTYPYGLAFDKSGGLWVSDDNEYALRGFTAAQIAASGAPVPNVLLTGGAIVDPEQIAFDEWVVTGTPLPLGTRVAVKHSPSARTVVAKETTRSQ